MIAIINDKDSYGDPTTIQLVEYKETHNKKVIIITRSFLFHSNQPGEMEFPIDSTIPKSFILTENIKEIIDLIFTRF